MHDIFVFEDNGPENGLPGLDEKYTPSSELLLGSFNGQNMRFLNGVGHAFDKLLRIAGQDGNSRYIVFYDVSPNNKNTINGYRGLVERCKLFQNIYVIPIICIEYYITHMMDKFGILQHNEDVDPFIMYLVSTFDWKKFLHTYRGGMYEQCYKEDLKDGKLPRAIRSLEKSYKYILEKQPWECLKNSNSGIHNKRGYFYKNDCNCKDCIWHNKYIRLYKAEYLVCSLPVFAVVSNEHLDVLKEFGLPFESEDFYLTLKQQIEFYNKLSRDMGFTSIFSQELTSTPDFIL